MDSPSSLAPTPDETSRRGADLDRPSEADQVLASHGHNGAGQGGDSGYGGGGDRGKGSGGDGDDDREPQPAWWRRAVDALTPRGTLQIGIGVFALCFLVGAIGYTIGTQTTTTTPTSDLDRGFLVDMLDHHDQAIQMASCAIDQSSDRTVRSFAKEVLIFQRWEIGVMETWLDQLGEQRPDPDRNAMGWMGMPVPVKDMPGMADDAEVDALCAATGPDVDRAFLQLMREHHRGGKHMADYAATHATSPQLRTLAESMSRNQGIEINEYTATLRRLGLE